MMGGHALELLLARLLELLDLGVVVSVRPRDGVVDLVRERLFVRGVDLVRHLSPR